MATPFEKLSPVNPEYVKLLEDYLDKRCLSPSDFPEGLVPYGNRQFLRERNYSDHLMCGRPYIFLTYLDASGNPYPGKDAKGQPDPTNPYAVARFLGKTDELVNGDPPPKILSQKDRQNQLHFEPIQPIEGEQRNWFNLPKGQIVVHVESMIKAKAVHKWTGFPTVGLNGVGSFASSKRGIALLHSESEVDFTQFTNVILFDSNITKQSVKDCLDQFAHRLKNVAGCADVRIATLPKAPDGSDWGPDDFMRENGNEALIKIIREAEPYVGEEHDDLLATVADRLLFCLKSGNVIDRVEKIVRSTAKARERYLTFNKKILKRGAVSTVEAFKVWMESKSRGEVMNPAYEYLGEEFIEEEDGVYYNLYQRGGAWPGEGDASEIVRHLEQMISVEDLKLLRAYLKYLKFGKIKPTSFPVLYSDKRGVGKGWFTKLAHRLIGMANATNSDSKAFVSNFNALLANKRLVIVNEFKVQKSGAKDAAMNSIKRFFGDEYIIIEPKGVDAYQLKNLAGMIITANALEDVPTDGLEDRRMWYVECHLVEGSRSEEYWDRLHSLCDNPGAMSAFARWVEEGEDINFATWLPPLDEKRREAIRLSSHSIEAAAMDVLDEVREAGFVCVGYPLIVEMLKREGIEADKMAVKTLSSILKKAGWEASEKKYGKNGVQAKVWIADSNRFGPMALAGTEVSAEMARAAKHFLNASDKY